MSEFPININASAKENISNKKTNLTDNSDTFYPTQKAVKTAVDAKFNTPTGTTAQYLRGDGSVATFPTIPSTTGLVPYTGATGDVDLGNNDLNAEGIKIKGTGGNGHLNLKHQSSGASAGGGESVIYADNSGNPKWKNDGNAVQSVLLSGTTTADIADSTNKRYVTDANLTVIGNTSGTNTGDETQSTILTKLGWFQHNRVAESTTVTGTTAETIIENITIPANTFTSGGILRSYNNKFRKVGTAGSLTVRLYIGPNANNLSGATQIAIASIPNTNLFAEILRTFTATTTSLLGWASATSSTSDVTVTTAARTETAVTWSVTQNLIITVQLGNGADSVTLIGASLKNF
jgi:hypothetical protein